MPERSDLVNAKPRTPLEMIVHLLSRPSFPGSGLTEAQAWNLLGDLSNQFGDYVGDRIDEGVSMDEGLGMRRGHVLFLQMVTEGRPAATKGSTGRFPASTRTSTPATTRSGSTFRTPPSRHREPRAGGLGPRG